MKKSIISFILFCTLYSQAGSAEMTEDVIQQAKMSQKKAASVNSEWRDVAKFIQQAEQALAKGEKNKAHQLALIAKEQADLGYQQAISQQNMAMPGFLK